jgi:hypothetical protein
VDQCIPGNRTEACMPEDASEGKGVAVCIPREWQISTDQVSGQRHDTRWEVCMPELPEDT